MNTAGDDRIDRVVESHDEQIENTEMNTAGDDKIYRVVESHDKEIENTEMNTQLEMKE